MNRDPSRENTSIKSELYRHALDLARFPMGLDRELVYSSQMRKSQLLSSLSVRILLGCREFAALDDHAVWLGRDSSLNLQGAPLQKELFALVDSGLLASRHDFLALCQRDTGRPASPITAVTVPTRNRTASLERCLRSYLENNQRHGRPISYVVADDSDDVDCQRTNRQLLRALKTTYSGNFAYAGSEERASYAEALIKESGLPPEDVQFAILPDKHFRITTGSTRNALLLHTAGETVLQVDDDTICSLAPSPERQNGVAFSSEYDPTEFWFLAENEQPQHLSEAEQPGLLAIHEQLLGQGLGSLVDHHEVDLNRSAATFFGRLEPAGGRVLVTASGSMGDSGMGSPIYFLSLEGASRSRLLQNEKLFRHALARQQVVRTVRRPTVCDGPYCMAMNLGLDNRDLLPPFMPVQRNQDGVFAAILRACVPGGYFGFVPWTILHQVPVIRRLSPEECHQSATRVTSGQVLQALISTFAPGPNRADARKSMNALGQAFIDWGLALPADFAHLLRLLMWNQASRKVMQLENLLRSSGGQPAFWADDVRQFLTLWKSVLPNLHYAVPHDLLETAGDDACASFQRLVHRFGRLLRVWPDMVDAAKQLRAGGRRLAVNV